MNWFIQLLNPDGSATGNPINTASLGIEDIEYSQQSLAADTWTFTVGGAALDAAALWSYGQLMAIQDANGVRRAFGRIEPWTRQGTPDAQNHIGRLVNPWWYLTRKVYQQRYSVATGNFPVAGQVQPPAIKYTVLTTSRVILFVLFNGQTGFFSATTGQQITDALQWAILQGAPIQIGQMDPGTKPFSDFQKGIMCSEVIQIAWKKEPDFIMDWDYTTAPFPTVHFRKAQSFVPLTIDLRDTVRREQVQIRERPDWIRSYVNICYDQTNQQNGQSYLNIVNDLYPNPIPPGIEAAFRGVDLYCDLSGSSTSVTTQTVSLATLPIDITNVATWKRWKPDLAAGTVASVVIMTANTLPAADGTRPAPSIVPRDEFASNGFPIALDPTCIYEVVDGEWTDWSGVNGQRVRCTAWACITHQNGEITYVQINAEPTLVSVNTNGAPQLFSQTNPNTSAYAEPIPAGLAQAMWTSWSALAIEGSFTNVEAVIGTQIITRSTSLNFLTNTPGQNGRPDWRNVNALVQRISGSFLKGTTKVEFGAPLEITGNELIDAIRATRYRVSTIDLAYLFGGAFGGGSATSQVKLGRKTHARAAHHGGTHTQVAVTSQAVAPGPADSIVITDGASGITTWTPPNAPVGGSGNAQPTVTINPAAKGSDGNWHPLSIQEFKVCATINGVMKQRSVLALASAIYQGGGDPA